MVAAGLVQALAYLIWIAAPEFTGFAVGFVVWGIGGALASGATEALIYDAMAAANATDRFARVYGRMSAAGLIAQLPAAGLAVVLAAMGGYVAAGLVSVSLCIGAALLARSLPDIAPHEDDGAEATADTGMLATVRAGLALTAVPGVLLAALAVAATDAIDAFEEYFPLLVAGWDVPVTLVPLAVMAVALAGTVGAATAGRIGHPRPAPTAAGLLLAAGALAGAAVLDHPGSIAILAAFYGIYVAISTALHAALQHRITGHVRATVTSIVGMLTELAAFAVYGAWAIGGTHAVATLVLLAAALVMLAGRRAAKAT